jgi:hypothetical protein
MSHRADARREDQPFHNLGFDRLEHPRHRSHVCGRRVTGRERLVLTELFGNVLTS